MKLTTEIPNSAGCAVEATFSGLVRTEFGSAVSTVPWFDPRLALVSMEDKL